MLFDSHTHVNFKDFDNDRDEVIRRCLDEDIWMINVGTDAAYSKKAVEIAHAYPTGVYAAVGVHPHDSEHAEGFFAIEELAQDRKVVAIGETGLDYCCNQETKNDNAKFETIKEKQKALFIKHIELAQKVKKPLIIHCRDAHDDLIKILVSRFRPQDSRFKIQDSRPKGVMHFFGGAGAWENIQKYLEMGFYISFSGVVTFPKYSHGEDIKRLPMDRILIETDAPYVAPEPHRGKRNEPSYVRYAAQRIADIRGLSFKEVASQTTQNARKLFAV